MSASDGIPLLGLTLSLCSLAIVLLLAGILDAVRGCAVALEALEGAIQSLP